MAWDKDRISSGLITALLFLCCIAVIILPADASPMHMHDKDRFTEASAYVKHMSQSQVASVSDAARLRLTQALNQGKVGSSWKHSQLSLKPEEVWCYFCKAATFIVQQLLMLEKSQDEVAKVVTAVCKTLNIEDDRVCDSIVQVFKVRNTSGYCQKAENHKLFKLF